jgi:hypothetical protein
VPDGRRLRGISTEQAIRAFGRVGYSDQSLGWRALCPEVCRQAQHFLAARQSREAWSLIYQVKQAGMTIDEFEELLK